MRVPQNKGIVAVQVIREFGAPLAVCMQQKGRLINRRYSQFARPLRPPTTGLEKVGHEVDVELERVVLIEDDHGMVRIGEGGICAGDDAPAANAAMQPRRRSLSIPAAPAPRMCA